MPHKAAELVGSRHAHGQCLAAHGGVKFRVGRLHVRFQKEAADAEGEHAEQQPAKEGQLEDEEVPLLALHHLLAQFHSAGGGHIGVFGQQVGHQRIAILPVNARHNEQQEAQRDFQVGKQLHHDGVAVGAAEGADDGGDGRQGLAALHKIAAAADVERVDDKECPAKRGNRADEHTDEDRPQHTVGDTVDDVIGRRVVRNSADSLMRRIAAVGPCPAQPYKAEHQTDPEGTPVASLQSLLGVGF